MSRAQKHRPTIVTTDIRRPAADNRLLARLMGVVRSGTGWTARCPVHDDNRNSLSIHHRDGRWLLYCHAGCGWRAIIEAIGIEVTELFDKRRERGS
jgi:putative DNA primase/helicase